jgi:hypothetical protein
MEYDIMMRYPTIGDGLVEIEGVSVAGKSLIASNGGIQNQMVLTPENARDFQIFAQRRGLTVGKDRL